MITSLHFKSFKSWADTGSLRFAPLTGFFGSNSSGKTGIIQFLLMLKQTVESSDRAQVLQLGDERSYAQLGTFREVIHGHDQSGSIRWKVGWGLGGSLKPREAELEELDRPVPRTFEAEVSADPAGRLTTRYFRYQVDATLGLSMLQRRPGVYYLQSDGPSTVQVEPIDSGEGDLPPPVKCYGFPPEFRTQYLNADYAPDLQLQFERLFDKLFYLGPLREHPKREYPWTGTRPTDVGRRGERAVEALLAAKKGAGNRREDSLEARVARWLRELGLIHEFRVVELAAGSDSYQVKVRQTEGSPEVLITDVGFGVSQILPALVLCYSVPEGSTVILEQPEIHLHPSVQAGLADVFIDAIQTRGIQIVLESHSEYLLQRLQRRIAEENDLGPDDVALYFCSMKDGASHAEPLEVDPYGNITNWPQDFFGDEMADLAARTKAAMERKKKAAAG